MAFSPRNINLTRPPHMRLSVTANSCMHAIVFVVVVVVALFHLLLVILARQICIVFIAVVFIWIKNNL